MTEVRDLVANISQRQKDLPANRPSGESMGTFQAPSPRIEHVESSSMGRSRMSSRSGTKSAQLTPTRNSGGSRDRQQFMTPRMNTSPRTRSSAGQSPRSALTRSSSMRTPVRDARGGGTELDNGSQSRRGSSNDASLRRTWSGEQVSSPTYYFWDSSTGEFVEDIEREHQLNERAHARFALKGRMTALMSKRQDSKAHLAWLHDETRRIAEFQQRNLPSVYKEVRLCIRVF